MIDAGAIFLVEFARPGALGAVFAQHMVGGRRQFAPPFLVAHRHRKFLVARMLARRPATPYTPGHGTPLIREMIDAPDIGAQPGKIKGTAKDYVSARVRPYRETAATTPRSSARSSTTQRRSARHRHCVGAAPRGVRLPQPNCHGGGPAKGPPPRSCARWSSSSLPPL